ncbi:MAG TPA: hypothetical protein VHN78_14430, partial [Chloroflexota bacterium]|nr:hypothetical protein [Chloroflexota bacterium]
MIVFLSTADTDRLTLQRVLATRGGYPVVVAANPAAPGAAEAAIEALGRPDRGPAVAVLRLHGGRRACPAAAETVVAACRERSIPLIALSGEGLADEQ